MEIFILQFSGYTVDGIFVVFRINREICLKRNFITVLKYLQEADIVLDAGHSSLPYK